MTTTSGGTVELEQHGQTAILRVTGALDLITAPRLGRLFDRALRQRADLVVADLTRVDFLASAGMAELVRAHRSCVPPIRLHVVVTGRITMRPLELTRLTDELTIFPTVPDALAAR